MVPPCITGTLESEATSPPATPPVVTPDMPPGPNGAAEAVSRPPEPPAAPRGAAGWNGAAAALGTNDGVVAEMPPEVTRPSDAAADVARCGALPAEEGTKEATFAARPPEPAVAPRGPAALPGGTNGTEVEASCGPAGAGGGMLMRMPAPPAASPAGAPIDQG